MRRANDPQLKDLDLRTERHWIDAGRVPLNATSGEAMYTNGFYKQQATYWSFVQTRPATPDELQMAREALHNKELSRRRESYKRRKDKINRARREKRGRERAARLLAGASDLPAVPCENQSGIVVFDLETTGLNPYDDEILQVSAIDGEGKTLINAHVRPYYHEQWPAAERVNGISPSLVRTAPQIHELIPTLKGIFASAEHLVSYNGVTFDSAFLSVVGIDIRSKDHTDMMLEFAPVYGEWSESHGRYKYQSLTTCAAYYGYSFHAHDALEDCRATLHCYNRFFAKNEQNFQTNCVFHEESPC